MSNIVDLHRQAPPDLDRIAIQFGHAILPSRGRYCAWTRATIGQKGGANKFFRTIEALWAYTREANDNGKEVYFALGSFDEEGWRTQDCVLFLKSFWADIDWGEKKPYKNMGEAIKALKLFCGTLKLPMPVMVESGHGLHVYWPLKQEISPEVWLPYAQGFKAAFVEHEFYVDPKRTADSSSILRMPGTSNFKDGKSRPLPVRVRERGLALEPYDLAEFEALLQYASRTTAQPTSGLPSRPPYLGDSVWNDEAFPPHADNEWSAGEEQRLRSALEHIAAHDEVEYPNGSTLKAIDDRDSWFKFGAALHDLCKADPRWPSRKIWDEWSKQSKEKFNEADQNATWASYGRGYTGTPITVATIRARARKCGWADPAGTQIDENSDEGGDDADAQPDKKNAIVRLNKRHFLIRDIGGKCLVGTMVNNTILGSGQMLSLQTKHDFCTWYGNQFVEVVDDQGKPKQKSLGEYWLHHSKRRGYEGVDLVPNAAEELPNGYLNLWRGLGVKPKPGDWPLMKKHISDILAGGADPEGTRYILRWAAWAVQHPGERAEVALVFRGGRGCGKGVFIRALKNCFGEHGLHITNQEYLTGRFNQHMRSCLLLFADEAFWAGDKRAEGVLKGLITEPTIMIEQKRIDAIQWPNRLKVVMAANADWVVPAGPGERRYTVFSCAETYVMGRGDNTERLAYFAALHHELENGGLEAMLHDLLHLDLGAWHPRQIHETEALHEQKEHSLSSLEEWWVEVLEDGELPKLRSGDPGWHPEWEGVKDFVLPQTLLEDAKAKVPRGWFTETGIGRFLKKQKALGERRCIDSKQRRGWKLPSLESCRQEWVKVHGAHTWRLSDLEDWQ